MVTSPAPEPHAALVFSLVNRMKTPRLFVLSAITSFGVIFLSACATPETPALRSVAAEVPPPPEGVLDVSEVSVRPTAKRRVPPRYPDELRRSAVTGEANIVFTVGVDGNVRDVVVASATDERFGRAAADAIRQWTFSPAQQQGRVVACRMSLPITFDLSAP